VFHWIQSMKSNQFHFFSFFPSISFLLFFCIFGAGDGTLCIVNMFYHWAIPPTTSPSLKLSDSSCVWVLLNLSCSKVTFLKTFWWLLQPSSSYSGVLCGWSPQGAPTVWLELGGKCCLHIFVVLGFELRASRLPGRHFYDLSHSTNPFQRWGLVSYLPRLAWNSGPPDLCLLSS
jgi:hypothetical protein